MKKTGITLIAAAALVISACGGGKTSEADTTATGDSTKIEIADAGEQLWLIKADSIYSTSGVALRTGTEINSLPESISGLYDKIAKESGMDALEISFMRGSEQIFMALDFGEAKADLFIVTSDHIKVATPLEGVLSLGSPFADVLALPGVKAEWSGYDGEGTWYWQWEGLWFGPAQDHLSEALSKKLYDSKSHFTADDFKDVTIGFLGTGLPF